MKRWAKLPKVKKKRKEEKEKEKEKEKVWGYLMQPYYSIVSPTLN